MLVLFMLLGTAFILTAKQSSEASKSLSRAAEIAASPMRQDDLLDDVFGQLLRDTGNQYSTLRYHSLLRDIYGNDGISGEVVGVQWAGGATNPTGGQIVEFQLDTTQLFDQAGNQITLSPIDNAYNGLLLTFIGKGRLANAEGQSVRIVGYRAPTTGVPPTPAIFRVMAFELADGAPLASLASLSALDNSKILINGRPFNGTGVGYNPTATTGARLNTPELVAGTNRELALMPNPVFFDYENVDMGGGSGDYGSYYSPQWTSLTTDQQQRLLANMGPVGQGGSDESYDAVDFQNMFLALMPANPVEPVDSYVAIFGSGSLQGVPVDIEPPPMVPIPSFHRPALINYWQNLVTGLASEPALLRKILQRPSWFDHPNFTGSNPDLAGNVATFSNALKTGGDTATPSNILLQQMIYGPWDVDNDNDGVRDSVWVDFGAPIIQTRDGKLVKPLAAILCIDLDGRLNLNAHGSRDLETPVDFNKTLAGSASSNSLPQGQGYGTADISLESVLTTEPVDPLNPPPYPTRYDEILFGELDDGDPNTREYPGRYGRRAVDSFPGKPGQFGLLAQLKMQGLPRKFDGTTKSAFNTPPDLFARYAIGVNDFGQPVYEAINDTVDLDQNSPYELNLSRAGTSGESLASDDTPFTVGELERLLRAYDTDASSLTPRLWELAGQFKSGGTTTNTNELKQWRTLLTTDSYDLPVPAVQAPAWMYYGLDRAPGKAGQDDDNDGITDNDSEIGWAGSDDLSESQVAGILGDPGPPPISKSPVSLSIIDLLRFRLKTSDKPLLNQNDISRAISSLLAPELLDGLRMDINRPLGNGRDDNNNRVVDEPGEMDAGAAWKADISRVGANDLPTSFTSARLMAYDSDQNGTISLAEDLQARQRLARDLYVLAMTLVDPFETIDPITGKPNPVGQAKARRLAQWAINAVDFRDPDSITTAFEYDLDPFSDADGDGRPWDVDGDLSGASVDNTAPTRGLVWGAERPELLISEVMAWHDRRTEDRATEDPNVGRDGLPEKAATVDDPDNPDLDFDQLYRPRGAAFIELYNPWPNNPGVNADTHRVDASGNDLGVDLARTHDQTATGSPVWRLAIYRNTRRLNGQGPHLPVDIRQAVFLDPDNPTPNRQQNANELDRCVYFTGRDPGYSTQAEGYAYFNDGTDLNLAVPPVRPGKYMLIGSGDLQGNAYVSPLGDLDPNRGGVGTPRRVELRPGTTNAVTFDGISPPADTCDVAIINRAPKFDRFGTAAGTETRRFTLSEPTQGYPDRVRGSLWNPTGGRDGNGWYGYGTETPNLPYPIDTPLDDNPAMQGVQPDPSLQTLGTVQAYRWIFLQRLANPLLAWNPEPQRMLSDGTKAAHPDHNPNLPINPYVTVDSSSANLTVFNGRAYREMIRGKWVNNGQARGEFSSVERGWQNDPADITPQRGGPPSSTKDDANPWTAENSGLRKNNKPSDSTHFFSGIPDMSLGYLNTPFDSGDKLTPTKPFPWLDWNNRPFISAAELLQVPAVRSSQLLKTFSILNGVGGKALNPYTGAPVSMPKDYPLESRPDGPFGHLQNFFRGNAGGSNDVIVGLHRILDYLQVPSRFVGIETWLNPTTFGKSLTGGANDPLLNRQPPFNRISTYRDPGRVNLNTIWHGDIWDGGILQRQLRQPAQPWDPWKALPPSDNNYLKTTGHDGPLFVDIDTGGTSKIGLLESRRGYETVNLTSGKVDATRTDLLLALDPNVPTFFANPFRSPDAGNLVPLRQLRREGVDCGLVRSDKVPKLTQAGGGLFTDAKQAAQQQSPSEQTLIAGQAKETYRDASRNTFFRYQPLTRLANLTTTRSNVFVVWVTIGFFEVEEVDTWASANQANFNNDETLYNRVYPDGYTFGKEAGQETGDVRRLRGFAIIDRTIPVAFEPGQEHNSRKAVRLQRRIE